MSEQPPEDGYDEGYAYYEDYFAAFEDLIGTTGRAETYTGGMAAPAFDWIELFEETGIATGSRQTDLEAFELFLLAFYPQNKSPDDWYLDREEFYDLYGIDNRNIDWEAYRLDIDSP